MERSYMANYNELLCYKVLSNLFVFREFLLSRNCMQKSKVFYHRNFRKGIICIFTWAEERSFVLCTTSIRIFAKNLFHELTNKIRVSQKFFPSFAKLWFENLAVLIKLQTSYDYSWFISKKALFQNAFSLSLHFWWKIDFFLITWRDGWQLLS
jgi:hypothetical protein